ncbi:MAG: hypothetical protein PUA81_09335 [Oscillospiraceae bacterium]|nr:hypothetical protein [Oscillospiraceae bacterium]
MSFFEILPTFFLVVVSLILLWGVFALLRMKKTAARYETKIKVKSNRVLFWLWIGIAAVNILTKFAAYGRDIHERNADLIFIIAWILFIVYNLMMIVFDRFYVTADGIIMTGMRDSLLDKIECSYRINGDTLEIYRKNMKSPLKYRIIENSDELRNILEANYTQYTSDAVKTDEGK